MVENIYFQLTAEFNARERIAVLASGQAVVYYRLAIMSKDGDWIVRETEGACRTILEVLRKRDARYRAGAPLDPKWLAGGWSSHFEFRDPQGRRIRCDFFSRPPRLSHRWVESLFEAPSDPGSSSLLPVVDVPTLIRMKQTQRAKDYPIIGEIARLLPPEKELEFTTDPDRIIQLATEHRTASDRTAVHVAREGQGRLAVVQALAVEIDGLQQLDRHRLEAYAQASGDYLRAIRDLDRSSVDLLESHQQHVRLAERHLPRNVLVPGDSHRADVE